MIKQGNNLVIANATLVQCSDIGNSTHLIKIKCPEIALNCYPGQFCNIKVSDSTYPLLRRPFSICDVEGENVLFMYNVQGGGTRLLSSKKIGDKVDILGPLGNGFNIEDEYDTAVIVAGGIGEAPFPFLINKLPFDKMIYSFVGGKSQNDIITYGLKNVLVSTDDGSLGFEGNVIELLEANIKLFEGKKIKIFGCGPNAMLRALKLFAVKNNFNCEVSTESAMACGFGICQGCPIGAADKDGYYLVCKDGPVFNVNKVNI